MFEPRYVGSWQVVDYTDHELFQAEEKKRLQRREKQLESLGSRSKQRDAFHLQQMKRYSQRLLERNIIRVKTLRSDIQSKFRFRENIQGMINTAADEYYHLEDELNVQRCIYKCLAEEVEIAKAQCAELREEHELKTQRIRNIKKAIRETDIMISNEKEKDWEIIHIVGMQNNIEDIVKIQEYGESLDEKYTLKREFILKKLQDSVRPRCCFVNFRIGRKLRTLRNTITKWFGKVPAAEPLPGSSC